MFLPSYSFLLELDWFLNRYVCQLNFAKWFLDLFLLRNQSRKMFAKSKVGEVLKNPDQLIMILYV